MAENEIITQQNDTVDLICYRHYGDTGMVVRVLEANPGLAARGTFLPMGLTLVMPPMEPLAAPAQVNLWT